MLIKGSGHAPTPCTGRAIRALECIRIPVCFHTVLLSIRRAPGNKKTHNLDYKCDRRLVMNERQKAELPLRVERLEKTSHERSRKGET